MNYRVIDKDKYYRKGVYRHFTEDCKCSTSMTARVDVTELVKHSKESGTKFYVNFLYILSKVLNSRDDYRMGYLWKTDELICYDVINPIQYIFHEDAENHPNWFDASYISWLSYDSLNIELPDGYLYFLPIINWGKYREENGRLMMPVTVRMNHAIADGYLIANVYRLLEKEIVAFCRER